MSPPHLCSNSSTRDAPAGTMEMHAHPTVPRNLTQEKVFESGTGILHVFSSDTPTLALHYWITTRSILPMFMQNFQEAGYDIIYFTPFLSEAARKFPYPENPISNTISVRRTKTTPPNFPSLAYSISTSPTLVTPPSHNPLSNPNVNPATDLVTLMQQSLQ